MVLWILFGIGVIVGLIDYIKKYQANLRAEKELEEIFSCCNTSLEIIDDMNGWEFEHFVAEILRTIGYEDVEVTPGSNDQGADVLARKNGVKYAIQCKRFNSLLNNKPIQEVAVGRAYYNCDVGVVLTNSYFNRNAIAAAEAADILLWDRDDLINMLNEASKK